MDQTGVKNKQVNWLNRNKDPEELPYKRDVSHLFTVLLLSQDARIPLKGRVSA